MEFLNQETTPFFVYQMKLTSTSGKVLALWRQSWCHVPVEMNLTLVDLFDPYFLISFHGIYRYTQPNSGRDSDVMSSCAVDILSIISWNVNRLARNRQSSRHPSLALPLSIIFQENFSIEMPFLEYWCQTWWNVSTRCVSQTHSTLSIIFRDFSPINPKF